MQLQDKLLEYKQQMGLLPSSTSQSKPAQLLSSNDDENTEVRPALRGLVGNKE